MKATTEQLQQFRDELPSRYNKHLWDWVCKRLREPTDDTKALVFKFFAVRKQLKGDGVATPNKELAKKIDEFLASL